MRPNEQGDNMKTTSTFSFRERGQSFKYAFAGIRAFFGSQHNAIIHLFFTVLVIAAALIFDISVTEAIALIIVTALVWAAEIFNTAIEAMMDHITPQFDPRVKFIKDVSAAAVLVTAIAAALVGLFIFIPKIYLYVSTFE